MKKYIKPLFKSAESMEDEFFETVEPKGYDSTPAEKLVQQIDNMLEEVKNIDDPEIPLELVSKATNYSKIIAKRALKYKLKN